MNDNLWERKLSALKALLTQEPGEQVCHPLVPASSHQARTGRPGSIWPEDPAAASLAAWQAAGRGLSAVSPADLRPLEIAATVASAEAGAGEGRALLLFTIASVQDFLASARRTQDLWFGSYLFSYLMWRAMEAIGRQVGYDVFLLPTLQRQPLLHKALESSYKTGELVVANLPNIFTALLPSEAAPDLARGAEAALWRARDEIFAAVKTGVEAAAATAKITVADKAWNDAWDRQRTHFLQPNVFWVIAPWDGVDDYGAASRRAGALLGARKTLRQFFATEEPEGMEKCTLCGVRAALAPASPAFEGEDGPGHDQYRRLRDFWTRLAAVNPESHGERRLKLAGRLRRGEGLCAVCVTKRLALQMHFTEQLGLDYHLFPSTASVATAPFVERVLGSAGAAAGQDLATEADGFAAEAIGFLDRVGLQHPPPPIPRLEQRHRGHRLLALDGQWLYPDSWTAQALDAELPGDLLLDGAAAAGAAAPRRGRGGLTGEQIVEIGRIREALRALIARARRDAHLHPPSPYLAVMALDADHMGDWIAGSVDDPGRTLAEHPSVTPGYHVALAVALRNFSLSLARIAVEEAGPGKLIYAGGDDVLALVPVETVLRTLQALRAFFRGATPPGGESGVPSGWRVGGGFVQREGGGPDEVHLVMGPAADLSAAVVFVHRTHPLSHAVEEVHRLLKRTAKGTYGRSAVAFRLMKRSGEPVTTGLKWSRRDAAGAETQDLLALLDGVQAAIGAGHLSPSLGHDMRREGANLPLDVQKKLLEHMMGRRPGRGRDRRAEGDPPDEPESKVIALLDALAAMEGESKAGPDAPWNRLADLLDVARFLDAQGEE